VFAPRSSSSSGAGRAAAEVGDAVQCAPRHAIRRLGAYLGLWMARKFMGESYVNNVFAQIGLIG
jgi:hypothetical protein